jgi:hypothetical protein
MGRRRARMTAEGANIAVRRMTGDQMIGRVREQLLQVSRQPQAAIQGWSELLPTSSVPYPVLVPFGANENFGGFRISCTNEETCGYPIEITQLFNEPSR